MGMGLGTRSIAKGGPYVTCEKETQKTETRTHQGEWYEARAEGGGPARQRQAAGGSRRTACASRRAPSCCLHSSEPARARFRQARASCARACVRACVCSFSWEHCAAVCGGGGAGRSGRVLGAWGRPRTRLEAGQQGLESRERASRAGGISGVLPSIGNCASAAAQRVRAPCNVCLSRSSRPAARGSLSFEPSPGARESSPAPGRVLSEARRSARSSLPPPPPPPPLLAAASVVPST